MEKVKTKYMIDPGDWESATGERLPAGSDGVLVVKMPEGQSSTCEWEYSDEHERWDTECDDVIALHAGESPFEYGFKFCPFCGKEVREK